MIPIIDREKTGKQIRMIMELRGISVHDVQESLSLGCVQSVYHWFDGKSMPTLDNLYALACTGFFLTTGSHRNTWSLSKVL